MEECSEVKNRIRCATDGFGWVFLGGTKETDPEPGLGGGRVAEWMVAVTVTGC